MNIMGHMFRKIQMYKLIHWIGRYSHLGISSIQFKTYYNNRTDKGVSTYSNWPSMGKPYDWRIKESLISLLCWSCPYLRKRSTRIFWQRRNCLKPIWTPIREFRAHKLITSHLWRLKTITSLHELLNTTVILK